MTQLYEKLFSTGTWFATVLYFIKEHLNADTVFSSIISMLSLTLLVLQILNQLQIRKDKKKNK